MSGTSRQDLVRDAVTFLRDPKVTSSPLVQKVQFLESKGLTSTEIEQALHTVSSGGEIDVAGDSSNGEATTQDERNYTGSVGTAWKRSPGDYAPAAPLHAAAGYGYQQQQQQRMMLRPPPEPPRRDWRDYFIMAVVSGGVMYGLAALTRKYLLPHLQPPTKTSFEETSHNLSEQFDAAQALLDDLKNQTKDLQDNVEGEREKVEGVVKDVREMIDKVSTEEDRWRNEMREMREEVDELKSLVPKVGRVVVSGPSSPSLLTMCVLCPVD